MKDIIEWIKEILLEIGGDCYIVGGYTRDKLLNLDEESLDIDIIYSGDINLFIEKLKHKDIRFYILNEEAQIFRGTIKGKTIDVAFMKGKNIEEDLVKRDFTINAIALNILENRIIDPFNGAEDIKSRTLREVSDISIKNDRVRILRGIRFYIKYRLNLDLYTKQNIKNEAKLLMKCPKERVFEEFMKILHYDSQGEAFNVLDTYGILTYLIPGIDDLKTIGKCKYHMVDAFTHMNTTYAVFKRIQTGIITLKHIDAYNMFSEDMGNFKTSDFLSFAAFVHDIGKYKCYKNENEKVSFKGHDKVGAKIVREVCININFPTKGRIIVEKVVEGHMYPLALFKNGLKNYKKRLYKFFTYYEGYVPYILLISFCDVYATRIYKDEDNEKEKYKNFIESIFYEYSIYMEIKDNRLLNGNEIASITGITGKDVGVILSNIDKLRYLNELNTKKEAIQYIRSKSLKD